MGKKKKPIGVKRKRGKKFVWHEKQASSEVAERTADSFKHRHSTNQFAVLDHSNPASGDFDAQAPSSFTTDRRRGRFRLDDQIVDMADDDYQEEETQEEPPMVKKQRITHDRSQTFEQDHSLSRKDRMKEMILQSKANKYERQSQRDKDQQETEDLDIEFQSLISMLPPAQKKVEEDEFESLVSRIKTSAEQAKAEHPVQLPAKPTRIQESDPLASEKHVIYDSPALSNSTKAALIECIDGKLDKISGQEIATVFSGPASDAITPELAHCILAVCQGATYFPEIIRYLQAQPETTDATRDQIAQLGFPSVSLLFGAPAEEISEFNLRPIKKYEIPTFEPIFEPVVTKSKKKVKTEADALKSEVKRENRRLKKTLRQETAAIESQKQEELKRRGEAKERERRRVETMLNEQQLEIKRTLTSNELRKKKEKRKGRMAGNQMEDN